MKYRKITASVFERKPTRLDIPIRELDVEKQEELLMGFRQEMVMMGEHDGVDVGAGSDFIILRWGDKSAVVRGGELLRAWVASFNKKDADRFPKGIEK